MGESCKVPGRVQGGVGHKGPGTGVEDCGTDVLAVVDTKVDVFSRFSAFRRTQRECASINATMVEKRNLCIQIPGVEKKWAEIANQ